ncbi:MAG: DUF192 domain-containing protein [Candidatus Omnitrophica bacterium]|nr:DUF192 domain-containing protein [Candidatus Omnitrophota bacterium]
MWVVDLNQRKLIADSVREAGPIFERMRGLIGHPNLKSGEGLLLPRCQGIHTFGMGYPIDVVYLDREGHVIRLASHLLPNSFGPVLFRARFVLELPEGTIERSQIELGDRLGFFKNQWLVSAACG